MKSFANSLSEVFCAFTIAGFLLLAARAEGYTLSAPIHDHALAQARAVLNADEGQGADTQPFEYGDTPAAKPHVNHPKPARHVYAAAMGSSFAVLDRGE